MDQSTVNRINELYRKSKSTGLTLEELHEQQLLRKEYINAFRGNLQSTLESIVVVDKDGNRKALGNH